MVPLPLFISPNSCKVAKTGLQERDQKMAQMGTTAGIDVSKHWLDITLWPDQTLSLHLDRRQRDWRAALTRWLTDHEVRRVGLEASGRYEIELMDVLQGGGFEVVRFNAYRIRMFARSIGRLAKNDQTDAAVIAQAVAVLAVRQRQPRRQELDPLVEQLSYRRRLCDWIVDCTNQLEHLRDKGLRRQTERRRPALSREPAQVDARLAEMIAGREDWYDLSQRLHSVPGVGPVLAARLIALLPELGQLSRRAIASLVGVAPFDHDSGRTRGERHVNGGRTALRHVLYMATLAAMRCNPLLRAFAKRLAGKKPKVIITACMRKLLVILNAMLRDGADWRLETT